MTTANLIYWLGALVLALVCVAIVGAFYLQFRNKPKRGLRYNDEGELVAIEEVLHQQPFRLQGKGTYASEPLELEHGTYKVQYRFPPDVLVKIDIIRFLDGETSTILIKRGMGEASFTVEVDDRYVFEIAPADEISAWELAFTRLGLPSGKIPRPDE
jgi:hypothetical protein